MPALTEEDTFNALKKWPTEKLCRAWKDAYNVQCRTGKVINGENFWKHSNFSRSGWNYSEFCRAYIIQALS